MPKVIEELTSRVPVVLWAFTEITAIKKKKRKEYRALNLKDHQRSVLMTAGHSELGRGF